MTLLQMLFGLVAILPLTSGFAAQGVWDLSMSQERNWTVKQKTLYKKSKIMVNIKCEGEEDNPELIIKWKLIFMKCSNILISTEFGSVDANMQFWKDYSFAHYSSPPMPHTCDSANSITLMDRTSEVLAALNVTQSPVITAPEQVAEKTPAVTTAPSDDSKKGKQKRAAAVATAPSDEDKADKHKIAEIPFDGIYIFTLEIETKNPQQRKFNITATLQMKGPYGYLAVVDWPLLPFYGTMCVIYIIFGFIWFLLCACNWRDLLRIQLWIGAIIILGMLEKAVFFAEYESLNMTGQSVRGAVVFAELVSCVKRALARMLVVIISLGFGIVKPRLGAMLHRIVGMGVLYFVLASVEGCMRALKDNAEESKKSLLAAVPLAVLDAAICWWIFTSLVQVMRTLRLRRNMVKLSLYRHFTNTLIFAVLASIGFMVWTLKQHKMKTCITDWKELWVDEVFWHLLFSIILMVIMILWRPSATSQRYAFSAISDTMDEQDEAPLMNDAFDGMKMRGANDTTAAKRSDPKAKTEEDLKWIEENIPASVADVALPSLLDSDEEVMTTKFEMSKME